MIEQLTLFDKVAEWTLRDLQRLERQCDAMERAAGSKWREEPWLLPDEEIIRNEKLT